MPLDVVFIQNGAGLLVLCSGVLTGEEVIDSKKPLLEHPERLRRCAYVIVDVCGTTAVKISQDELREAAVEDRKLAAIISPGALVAILAQRDVTYGMSRMWQTFAEATGWEIMVFRSREELDSWLRVRLKEKFGLDLGLNFQRNG